MDEDHVYIAFVNSSRKNYALESLVTQFVLTALTLFIDGKFIELIKRTI